MLTLCFVEGKDMNNRLSFLVYRLENGEWNKLVEENRFGYRYGHSCQVLTIERLVILGGVNFEHKVDVLDLKSLTWSTVSCSCIFWMKLQRICLQGPRIPIELTHNFSVFYQGILYVIRWEVGDVYSMAENLMGEWVTVRHYGNSIPMRQVFPAPIVKYSDFC